MKLSESSN